MLSESLKYLAVAFLCLSVLTGCHAKKVRKKSEVQTEAVNFSSKKRGSDSIKVVVTNDRFVSSQIFDNYASFDSNSALTKIGMLEIKKALLADDNFKVYEKYSAPDYIIVVECTEFVPDIAEAKGKVSTSSLSTTIAAAQPALIAGSAYLPLVGTVVASFEPLTGIALGTERKEMIGLVRFDVRILSGRKAVLRSREWAGSFGVKVAQRGGDSSISEYKVVVASQAQDGARAAIEEAVKDFKSFATDRSS